MVKPRKVILNPDQLKGEVIGDKVKITVGENEFILELEQLEAMIAMFKEGKPYHTFIAEVKK